MGAGAGSAKKYRHRTRPSRQVARPTREDRGAQILVAAKDAVAAIVAAEVAKRQRLWKVLEVELKRLLQVFVPSGSSQEKGNARSTLLAAVMLQDSTSLGIAILKAAGVGVVVASADFKATFEKLLAQEEVEGLWLCLASALSETDAIALEFWLDEARSRAVIVPKDVKDYWESLTQVRAVAMPSALSTGKRLTDFDYQEVLEMRALDAYARRDLHELRRLAEDAKRLGADPGIAVCAMLELEELLRDEGIETIEVPNSTLYCGGAFADPELEALKKWSAKSLKDELDRCGVDVKGICEKEELVLLLSAARKQAPIQMPRAVASVPVRKVNVTGEFSRGGSSTVHGGGSCGVDCKNQQKPIQRPANATHDSRFGAERQRDSPQADSCGNSKQTPGSASCPKGAPCSDAPPRNRSQSKSQSAPDSPPVARSAKMTHTEAKQCLGFSETSTPSKEELRKAYKAAALRFHPDRPHNHEKREEATRLFQDSRTAYEILGGS